MFIAVFARRLAPDKTYEDFIDAWYPDKGFGVGGRGPIVARNVADEREILTVGLMDVEADEIGAVLERIGSQEAARHERIEEVIEETTVRGFYEVTDEFDFSTDETVAAGRP
jgi:hypothetical protein